MYFPAYLWWGDWRSPLSSDFVKYVQVPYKIGVGMFCYKNSKTRPFFDEKEAIVSPRKSEEIMDQLIFALCKNGLEGDFSKQNCTQDNRFNIPDGNDYSLWGGSPSRVPNPQILNISAFSSFVQRKASTLFNIGFSTKYNKNSICPIV